MRAGFDNLLYVVVFLAIGALSNWLQRKRQNGGESEAEPPSPAPPVRRSRAPGVPAEPVQDEGWEEELRRLLGGEPVQIPAPPPVPFPRQAPAPQAVPPVPHKPPVPAEPVWESILVEQPRPARPAAPVERETEGEGLPAGRGYDKAARLDQLVGAHMREVTHHPVQMTHVERRAGSLVAGQAAAMIRNPRTQRTAWVVATILGPPKAVSE